MRGTARWTTLLLALWVAAMPAPAQDGTDVEGIEMVRGREYTTAFYKGELDQVYAKFTDGFKAQMSKTQFRKALLTVSTNLGVEQNVFGERVQFGEEYKAYIRLVEFSKDPAPHEVVWLLRDDLSIAGFRVTKARPSE